MSRGDFPPASSVSCGSWIFYCTLPKRIILLLKITHFQIYLLNYCLTHLSALPFLCLWSSHDETHHFSSFSFLHPPFSQIFCTPPQNQFLFLSTKSTNFHLRTPPCKGGNFILWSTSYLSICHEECGHKQYTLLLICFKNLPDKWHSFRGRAFRWTWQSFRKRWEEKYYHSLQ